jgi:hypothetical protein
MAKFRCGEIKIIKRKAEKLIIQNNSSIPRIAVESL